MSVGASDTAAISSVKTEARNLNHTIASTTTNVYDSSLVDRAVNVGKLGYKHSLAYEIKTMQLASIHFCVEGKDVCRAGCVGE